jgi:hypothetical protein
MEIFAKTREKIAEPMRNAVTIAVTALVVALLALIVAVKN